MGKQSKRPGRAARDVHATIRADAEALKAAPAFGARDAGEFPEIADLMTTCGLAVAAALPKSVVFEGRTYWLRVGLAMHLEIFAHPGDGEPLVSGMRFAGEEHGHAPWH